MTMLELARRAVIQTIGRNEDVWRNPRLAESYSAVAASLYGLPITITDKVDITMAEIVAEAVRMKAAEGVDLVIVDYAQQVVDDSDPRARYLQVGDVAEKAVVLANAASVPVLIASQVNTIREKLGNAIERVGYTFRESAKLEHKASVVLIFDRRFDRKPNERGAEERVESFIYGQKNRLGPQGFEVQVTWNKPLFAITPGGWTERAEDRPIDPPSDPDGDTVTADTPSLFPPLVGDYPARD
jgi:replicative DNA helicase